MANWTRLYDETLSRLVVRAGRDDIRLMLQVTSRRRAAGKLKYTAGSETGMGAFIGDIVPETAAARLREALDGLR